jgi:hypothetical protein
LVEQPGDVTQECPHDGSAGWSHTRRLVMELAGLERATSWVR